MRRTTTRTVATLGVVTISAFGLALPANADDAPTTLLTQTFGDASAPEFTRLGHGGLTNAPDGSDWAPRLGHDLKPAHANDFLPEGQEIPQTDARRGAPRPGETGAFQLTDNNHDKSGGVVYNHALPTSGGLDISFQQRQYNSSTVGTSGGRFPQHTTGADGIAFFISDGSVELTRPGAFGGSLGYAQKTRAGGGGADIPGVAGGYLGVGLDVLGNYASGNEGRVDGKNSTWLGAPNSVTLRGPESTGYRYLTSAPATLSGDWQTVRVTLTPEEYPTVTVSVNGTKIVDHKMTTPMPETFKFGFTGSTGDLTDVHLVRMLDVQTIQPLRDQNTVEQTDPADPPAGTGPVDPTDPADPTAPGAEEPHTDGPGAEVPGTEDDVDAGNLTPDPSSPPSVPTTPVTPEPGPAPVVASPNSAADVLADENAAGPVAQTGGRLAATGGHAAVLAALGGALTIGGAAAVLTRRLGQQDA